MKLASYLWNGEPSYGIVGTAGVADLGGTYRHRFPTLKHLLAAQPDWSLIRDQAESSQVPLAKVRFQPVIPNSDAIFCVGLNYADHARETDRPLPKQPSTFLKLNRSLVGHESQLKRPKLSEMFDWEAELAIVIGRRGRHIRPEDALGHVAGYTCFNDGSIRDWQLERDLTQGKNFLSSGACGPWMVTTDELPRPDDLTVMSRLNGSLMQNAHTGNLIFPVPQLVAYLSSLTELRPGDMIATGTPGGVGHRRNPKIFMRAGDVIEVEITGIGVLRNTVGDE
jgi:2-keto-4-pentenoate hydratase/2-oxohepta-3-ene-1,7-dioic acid hydratase in catechol pathway